MTSLLVFLFSDIPSPTSSEWRRRRIMKNNRSFVLCYIFNSIEVVAHGHCFRRLGKKIVREERFVVVVFLYLYTIHIGYDLLSHLFYIKLYIAKFCEVANFVLIIKQVELYYYIMILPKQTQRKIKLNKLKLQKTCLFCFCLYHSFVIKLGNHSKSILIYLFAFETEVREIESLKFNQFPKLEIQIFLAPEWTLVIVNNINIFRVFVKNVFIRRQCQIIWEWRKTNREILFLSFGPRLIW